MDRTARTIHGATRSERGLGTLEILGLIAMIALLLAMIPFVREAVQDIVGAVFNRRDDSGEITDFSQLMRGIVLVGGSIFVFIGAGWLILSTNIGKHLAFLVTATAVFGWLTLSGILFVVYAPRGIRPSNLEGLNAFQIRVPAIALALGAFILFVMFVMALDRYERDTPRGIDERVAPTPEIHGCGRDLRPRPSHVSSLVYLESHISCPLSVSDTYPLLKAIQDSDFSCR